MKLFQINKKTLLVSLTAIAFIFAGCNENNVDPGDGERTETGENFTFYKSETMAEETAGNRSEEISDPFEINDVRIEERDGRRLMDIDVTQAQGCEESYPDKFEVIWDGVMIMIYPPQIGFYLKFNSDGCSGLEENVDETITLDLYELFGDKDLVDPAEFTVINASKSTSENDHDVNR